MSNSGIYYIIDMKTGRKFCVEPITGNRTEWGDVNPATKKIEGTYGKKYKGSIDENESVITERNGFKNIETLPLGTSPEDYVRKLLDGDLGNVGHA